MDGLTAPSVPLAVVLSALGAIALGVGIRRPDESRRWLVLGGAALVSGLLGLFGAPVSIQLWVFLAAIVAGSLLSWRWRTLVDAGDTLPTGAGAVRLVGMPATVIDTIPAGDGAAGWNDMSSGDRPPVRAGDRDPTRRVGRVRVGGEIWRAQSRDGTEVPHGSSVTVVAIRGTRLVVALAVATDQPAENRPHTTTANSRDEEEA